jgi:hypothetical protein
VGLPNETLEETEPRQGRGVRNRFTCPSPNIQQPTACLAESGQMAASTNPGGVAIGSPTSVEENYSGRDEEDAIPSQDVVQEEATYDKELPIGWTRVKLEPDC